MAYSLAQLLARFRLDMDDGASPYLWSDPEVYDYIDEAQKEFARQTYLFADTDSMAVTAGDPDVTLGAAYFLIRRAKLASTGLWLTITNSEDIDREWQGNDYYNDFAPTDWMVQTGAPRFLIFDLESGKGRVAPYTPPTESNDTITYWGYRYPADIVDSNSTLEVTERRDQLAMLWYVRALAYMKQDSETADARQAAKLEAKFFDYTTERKTELRRLRRRAGTVRYGGY